ncbi:MAG: Uma2 family endonuclease [Anaerolineae bacterium]|nr:Uma2 family endonuclease [Anaerolineae bacterium]
MVVQAKYHTAEDLWELSHLPEYVDMRLELREGELIVMAPSSWQHGVASSKFLRLIGDFVETHHLGLTTGAETGYILHKNPDGRDTVRAPDIGFVAAARVPDALPESGYVPFAPDLAVEIVSPNDKAHEVQDKVSEYLQFGTRLVWVAYPMSKMLVVHTPSGSNTLREADVLDGGDVLPGFRASVRELFG